MRASDVEFPPRDPRVTAPADRARLSGQCAKMLSLLESRPRVSNRELAAIGLKYTSRISDLREQGYLIVCTDDPAHDGLTWYTMRDLRRNPRAGFHLSVRGESRTILKVETDKQKRTWVLYRTAAPFSLRRVLLTTWRAWACQLPERKARRAPAARVHP